MSSTQNQGSRHPVSDIEDTARRTPDNDRVGDSQVNPVLGRTFVELAQRVEVVGDLGDRVAILRRLVELEGFDRGLSRVDVFGVADVA